MAVAAETANIETYISADQIPEVRWGRQEVREAAWELVRLREQHAAEHGESSLPLPVDALTTADEVLSARDRWGIHSEGYQERLAGLGQDCNRLVAEWYRKNTYEYFPPSRHFFDAETGDFYSHGLSIRQMTENALRPIENNSEEVLRRVNERVEEATPLLIKKLGSTALQHAGVRTISECSDKAIRDYQSDIQTGASHRGYGGYVPEKEKVMIRDTRIDSETGDRWQEQIGLPGTYIQHYVIQEALRRRGVDASIMGKVNLHGTQLIVKDDLIEFVKLLDTVASEEYCTSVYMGEEVAADHPKDYANIREQAVQRQEGLKNVADTVAVFILDLAEDGYDRRKAPAKVEEFVKMLLLDLAKEDAALAPQMFDEKTALGLQQVKQLEAQGRPQEAFELFQKVAEAAPGGGYCSGGSCGLESVSLLSKEGQELSKKLKAEPGDKVVKDTERACKCGSKKIVYAYNKNKVNKYCQNCDAFESKVTKAA